MDMDSGLVALKSKHFGFQYKLMGEASNSLILPIKKMTFSLTCLYIFETQNSVQNWFKEFEFIIY